MLIIPSFRPIIKPASSAAAAFPPTTTDIALWLKADGLSLSNDTPVSTFTDFSGLNRHFTAATSASRPTYRTTQQNNLPGVDFDGVGNVMTGSLDTGVTSYSLFMVLKMKSTSGNPTPFRHGDSTGITAGCYACILNGGNRNFQHRTTGGGATNMADGAASSSVFELWTLISTAAPLTTFRLNGVGSTLSPTGGAFDSPAGIGILGSFLTNTLFASCVIGELLLYKADVGTINRNSIETSLISKWSLS